MSYEVSSGITESGIILEKNTMTVLDGGVATDTTVDSGGGIWVSSGGTGESSNKAFAGLNDLDPDSSFIQALGSSRIKEGVIYHSIIGDREQADHAGGSDGVVPYSSSHLDGAASEVIVHSGHSVHRSPAAMRELLRILRRHLRENQQD